MQNWDISPIGTLHSGGVVMFRSHENSRRMASATTNLPLRVSLHVLVAFAICRLLSVVITGPTPIALCNHGVHLFIHVNHKPVGVATEGATPNASGPVIK